jgi:hypothetical protein
MIQPRTIYSNSHAARSPIERDIDGDRTTVRVPNTDLNLGWGPRLRY